MTAIPAQTRERDLNGFRSSFIALVSHEFFPPLAHILTSLELLEDCYGRMPVNRRIECFTDIKGRVRSLTRMVQDVLILGELEAGQHAFSPKPTDLMAYCRGLVSELQPSLPAAEAENAPDLRVSLAAPLQPVLLDHRLMSAALKNLLANAMKYSPTGAGPVEFRVQAQGDCLVFEVQDAGIGVPPEARARLFEAFFRAANARHVPGTGVGLSIVRLCAGLHGGTAAYEPASPAGSLFTLSIPLRLAGESRSSQP